MEEGIVKVNGKIVDITMVESEDYPEMSILILDCPTYDHF